MPLMSCSMRKNLTRLIHGNNTGMKKCLSHENNMASIYMMQENTLSLGCSRNGTKLEITSLSTGVRKRFSCII